MLVALVMSILIFFVFGTGALAIWFDHRQKMAAIRVQVPVAQPQALPATAEEVKELRELVVNLSLAVEQMRSEVRGVRPVGNSEISEYNILR